MLNHPDLPAAHPLNTAPASIFKGANSREFAPKLTKELRCEILALGHRGVQVAILAEAFGVHRRTIAAILNEDGTRYKEVRALRATMGPTTFDVKYTTEEGVARCVAAKANPTAAKSGRKYEAEKAGATSLAKRHAGRHIIKASPEGYDKDHLIDVVFVKEAVVEDYNNGDPFAAWGYHVVDGDNPDFFNCMYAINPPLLDTAPFLTSTAAYEHALNGGIV